MKDKFFYIDFIKVISCLGVMLFHLNVHSFYADNNATLLFGLKLSGINLGDIAVSLFIIVSGFGLGLSNRADFSIKKYARKRFLAIYPAFWVSYIIVALVFVFFLGKNIGENENPLKFILTIIGLDGLLLYKFTSFYLVGEWYTGYMILTYFMFPILFIYGMRQPFFSAICISGFIILLHYNYDSIFDMWEPINPLMRLLEFFFGIWYAQILRKDIIANIFLLLLSSLIIFKVDALLKSIPYHFVLIMFGISTFICIVILLNIIVLPLHIIKLFSVLSGYTFLAFLVHHQILLYFYERFDVAHASLQSKFSVFITVITISFLYAYMISPIVKFFSNKLNEIFF